MPPPGSPTCWLKADAGVEEAASDPAEDLDLVTAWLDQSGNARHFTPGPAQSPTYRTGIQNGLPVVRFDGSDDRLDASASGNVLSNFITASAGTVFVVAGNLTVGTNASAVYQNDPLWADLGGYVGIHFRTGSPYVQMYNYDGTEDVAQFTSNPTGWNVYTWMHSGGSVYGGISDTRDASLQSAASGDTANTGNHVLLGSGYAGTAYLACDIGEIVFYNTALSEADRKTCEEYLAEKWAITLPYGGDATTGGARRWSSIRGGR